ncbi:MAG TPA: hypothetical protein VL475_14315, partial [Planctomycetaceae bacterium]|nr:hypothetical protein [Planctomycetaceae bacterium]
MKGQRKLLTAMAVAALPLSLATGWGWHASHEPEFVAHARISVPTTANLRPAGDYALPNLEETLLSPDVVTAAVDLLAERGFVLPLNPAEDSEINFLLNRVDTACERRGNQDEIELSYRAADGEQALATLSAIADAGLVALRSNFPAVEDPAAGGRERERAQIASACEEQRGRVAELQEQITKRDSTASDSAATDEPLQALASALDDLREHRADAEDRLANARQQIRSGVDAAQIVAELPDDADWTALRENLQALQWKTELLQKDAARNAAAAIYGKNHPRMAGLRAETEQLRQKLALIEPAETSNAADIPLLASTLVLKTLEEKWQQAADAEQAAEERLAAASAVREQQQGLDSQLADARQELAFLKTEQDRIEREIAEAHRETESRLPGLSESPTLEPEPITPALTAYLLWAGAVGLALTA